MIEAKQKIEKKHKRVKDIDYSSLLRVAGRSAAEGKDWISIIKGIG